VSQHVGHRIVLQPISNVAPDRTPVKKLNDPKGFRPVFGLGSDQVLPLRRRLTERKQRVHAYKHIPHPQDIGQKTNGSFNSDIPLGRRHDFV
jgi:hypothetical protein